MHEIWLCNSGFLSLLLAHWFPNNYVKYRYQRCRMSEVCGGDSELFLAVCDDRLCMCVCVCVLWCVGGVRARAWLDQR
jgi:hypothetical protein